MKAILIVIVAVIAMVLLGWLTFSGSGDRPAVTVETDVMRQDVEQAAEATERVARQAADEGKRIIDEAPRVDVEIRRDSDASP